MTIRNIWAVGRNYADHAKELGNAVPTNPLIFLKAGSTATQNTTEIHLPVWAKDIHHEVELALEFGQDLQIHRAALALDLTERTVQSELKSKGLPWTLAKSFTGSCPLSEFFSVGSLEELKNLEISLEVNQQIRQKASTSEMIFSMEQLIDFVKTHFPVRPGDLLLTGTPAGVGPLQRGDQLKAELKGKIKQLWSVT